MKKNLIYTRKDLRTHHQVMVDGLLAFVGWLILIYLWLPLLAAIGWFVWGYLTYQRMIVDHEWHSLLAVLPNYLLVVACGAFAFVIWALLDYYVYRGISRRQNTLPLPLTEVANNVAFSEKQLAKWQDVAILIAYHDEQGHLVNVVSLDTPSKK